MVYDLFSYCGEDDLLEIRLETLKDVVDKFIICEAPISHTLIPKPMYFQESGKRFDEFSDKIIYVPAKYEHENPFVCDWAYRCILFDSIPNPKHDDIIVHSDLDEIPNPQILQGLAKNIDGPMSLSGKYFFWCLDLVGRKDINVIVMKHGWIQEKLYRYRDTRQKAPFENIQNASWHYSSVGTPENIARKWEFFAHSEEIHKRYKDPDYIKKQIKRKAGSWDENAADDELEQIEINYLTAPEHVVNNLDKYKHLLYSNYA